MNTQQLAQKLKTLNCLNAEEKSILLDLLTHQKRYGLVWEEKPERFEEELRSKLPILQEVQERRLVSNAAPNTAHQDRAAAGAPNHILIEGDNLHALTALNYTHADKVDVIYIDPPYNTGERDFLYDDKYVDKEDSFRHSKWLSFIIRRLRIAKSLLNETGVLLIHIDENEIDNLSLLLKNDVFDEGNYLGAIVWNKKNPKGDSKGVATMHEYVLCYAKNRSLFLQQDSALKKKKANAMTIIRKAKRLFNKIGKQIIPEAIAEVVKPFNYPKSVLRDFTVTYDLDLVNKEFQNWLGKQDFSGGEKAYKHIDDQGKVYRGVSMAWPNKEKAPEEYCNPLIHPLTNKPCPVPARGWRNPPETMQKLLAANLILFGNDENKQPERKYYLEDNLYENTPSIYNYAASDDRFFKEIKLEFPYAKPVEVTKYFLSCVHPNPKIILDFFAGSGTTLHAVMALNAEDGGKRQCILVTNNENNIAEAVCYERNKRVIQGYMTPKGVAVPGLVNNHLRYYKTASVDREKSLFNKRQLVRLSTEMLCIKEGCYDEVSVNHRDVKVFRNGQQHLMVIYDEAAIEQAIAIIRTLPFLCKVYVFANGTYPYTDEFVEVLDKVKLCAMPEAIYQAYQYVLPSRTSAPKPVLGDEETDDSTPTLAISA